MRGRKDDDDIGSVVDHRQVLVHEHHVGPDRTVGDHDALGEAGGAGGVVDQGEFFRLVLVVDEVVGGEAVGVHLVEGAGEVLADGHQVLVLGVDVVEGGVDRGV